MRQRCRREAPLPAATVIAALHDVAAWTARLPGAATAEVAPAPGGVELTLRLRALRELRLRLLVTREPDGLRYQLVEGDVDELEGTVRIEPTADGCALVWDQTVRSPVAVPGALARELEAEVMPRWIAALLDGAAAAT